MTSHGRLIGALFLAALLSNAIGSELAESTTERTPIVIGELLELLCGAAVVGIGALTYVALRHRSPRLAATYFGLRINEVAVLVVIVASAFTAVAVPAQYREIFLEQRYQAQIIAIYTYMFGGVVWYTLLYRLRLLPRFFAVWGFAGIGVLLVGSLLNLFGNDLDMLVYGTPLGLNELVLGIWLTVRGFDPVREPEARRTGAHVGA